MSFEKLLEQMDVLAKSQPTPPASIEDGKKIQSAAADGENNDTQTNADTTNGGDGLAADGITTIGDGKGDKGKDGEKPLTKSFSMTLADGTVVEAFDGTEMIKSLTERLEATAGELAAEKTANAETQTKVMKSFESAIAIMSKQAEALKAQELMIKSLTDKVGALANAGRGQRSVISVVDKNADQLAKSLAGKTGAMTGNEILAKSMVALKAGRITGLDATRIETHINMGVAVPADLLATISST